MARTVSTHRYAVEKVYLDGTEYNEEFEYFLEDLQELVRGKYPSFRPCDRWQDREDHIVLENCRAEVSVSEYCGLIAVCLAPLDPDNSLDQQWCSQISSNFRKLLHKGYPKLALLSRGSASNGEQFFVPVSRPEGLFTSKEGTLW